jgi:hypothetical protein
VYQHTLIHVLMPSLQVTEASSGLKFSIIRHWQLQLTGCQQQTIALSSASHHA